MKKNLVVIVIILILGISFSEFIKIEKKSEVSAYGASSNYNVRGRMYRGTKKPSIAKLLDSGNGFMQQTLGPKLGTGAEGTHVNDMSQQPFTMDRSQNPTKKKEECYGDKKRNLTTSLNGQTPNPADRENGGRPEEETRFKGKTKEILNDFQECLKDLKTNNTGAGAFYSDMVAECKLFINNDVREFVNAVNNNTDLHNFQDMENLKIKLANAMYEKARKGAQDACGEAQEWKEAALKPKQK